MEKCNSHDETLQEKYPNYSTMDDSENNAWCVRLKAIESALKGSVIRYLFFFMFNKLVQSLIII